MGVRKKPVVYYNSDNEHEKNRICGMKTKLCPD